jgi:hypothetical protein
VINRRDGLSRRLVAAAVVFLFDDGLNLYLLLSLQSSKRTVPLLPRPCTLILLRCKRVAIMFVLIEREIRNKAIGIVKCSLSIAKALPNQLSLLTIVNLKITSKVLNCFILFFV